MQCQFSFYQMKVFIVYYILHVRKVDRPQLGFIRLSSHVNVIKHHSIQTACGPRTAVKPEAEDYYCLYCQINISVKSTIITGNG